MTPTHSCKIVLALAVCAALTAPAFGRTCELAKLLASDGAQTDVFGVWVGLDGDIVIVGAPQDDNGSGSAYIFQRNTGGLDNWGEVAKLTASDADAGDGFGIVSISGDTVIVGARFGDDVINQTGSAYIFQRNHGGLDNWGEVAKLTASDADLNDEFGATASISGDFVVVGAHSNDDAGSDSGSAYIFHRNQGGPDNWGQVTKLTASDATSTAFFGDGVWIDVDTVIVGAYQDDDADDDAGAAYIFERNHGGADNWGEVAKLIAPDAAVDAFFGRAVSISFDTVIVGVSLDDDARSNSGAAYIFQRNEGGPDNWGMVTKIIAPDAAVNDRFGLAVSISGDTVIVGSPFDDDAGNESGSVYIFQRNEGGLDNWGMVTKITASDAEADDKFGVHVSITGETAVVGASGDDDNGLSSGSAYIIDVLGTCCPADIDGDGSAGISDFLLVLAQWGPCP